ncbi:MAG: RIP metalloprotease RseP [Gammaproteobacteria bacterium]|nr:MAG: RIP metalloprotease RseP [Gammaproteobacteria bacterium]
MTVLISILAFVVALGILVTVHEYGHFWVARRLGVRVLRFSVGFGRPLWKRVGRDGVEWVIAAIPLGGYVKMLDEREGEVPEDQRPVAFNNQPVWKRMAIVVAGPAANFLLAILLYTAMYLIGVEGQVPSIGEVIPDTPAARAGLRPNDTLVSANGIELPTWESATLTLLDEALDTGLIELEVADARGGRRMVPLDLRDHRSLLADGDLLPSLGMRPWRPSIPPVIGEISPNLPAERAGLRPGDLIVSANGQPIDDWMEWVEFVRAHPDQDVQLRIRRNGVPMELLLHPESRGTDSGDRHGFIGAAPRIDEQAYRQQLAAHRTVVRYGPLEALQHGVRKTWEASVLTLKLMWKMLMGEASVKTISGPLSIAQYAGISASIGLAAFLSFMGIVSVSLGVINLLPIPVLDGGHLLFYTVELVKGSPVSEQVERMGQQIGLFLLAGLMMLAFYNDLTRLLG